MPDDTERLLNHLTGAFQRAIRLTNEFAIAFPADLPSTILAALAREHSDVPFLLVHAALPGDPDASAARRVARHLGAPLLERRVPPAERAHRLAGPPRSPAAEAAPAQALERFSYVAQEARLYTDRLVLPNGAATALGGLAAEAEHYRQGLATLEARIAKEARVQLRYPYLDPRLLHLLENRGEAHGPILSRLGLRLGLPPEFVGGPTPPDAL